MSMLSFLLNVPKVRPMAPGSLTAGIRKQENSDARIGGYMKVSPPKTCRALAKALGYTQTGLRIVLKSLEKRNLVEGAGSVEGHKGRRVKLWKWIGD